MQKQISTLLLLGALLCFVLSVVGFYVAATTREDKWLHTIYL